MVCACFFFSPQACYLLRNWTDEFAGAEVVRTRDPVVLASLSLVCDVGAVYDAATHRYDHHQRSFNEYFSVAHESISKLSSAGLIYKHFGREIIGRIVGMPLTPSQLDVLYHKVYEDFVLALDACDNGVSQHDGVPRYRIGTSLPSRVGNLNPEWNEEPSQVNVSERFAAAMEMAGNEFVAFVRKVWTAWWPARAIVLESLVSSLEIDASGQLLVLQHFCPWKDHLLEIEHEQCIAGRTQYVLYADAGGSWRIQAVPIRADSFDNRRPLPAPWMGIRDEALSTLTGIPGCVFVHANGFIGGHKNYEGALQMARKALHM